MSTKLKQCKDMENQEIKTKRCPKCGRELPLSEFYSSRTTCDGLQSWCKSVKKKELGLIILTIIAIPTLRNLHRVSSSKNCGHAAIQEN